MNDADERHFRFLAENSADVICRYGLDGRLRYSSPSSFDVLGWTPEEMTAMEPFALILPEDVPMLVTVIEQNLTSTTASPVDVRMVRKDGSVIWVEITARVVRDSAGEPVETVTAVRDISERKLLEQKLSSLALTDGLTGIANRRAFDEALEREWKRTLREGSLMSLLLLDIDHFKEFNDHYGHQVGDDCLRAVTSAVVGAVRSTDIVARYGGEEIAIILPTSDMAGAIEAAEKARIAVEALQITHEANREGRGLVSVSIGVATALARQGGTMRMPESLLQAADNALYKAKHEGRNRIATSLLLADRNQ
jgi:diguanylate cyclase (GGDEF)-like protein/PAS domain S-box-containing protein